MVTPPLLNPPNFSPTSNPFWFTSRGLKTPPSALLETDAQRFQQLTGSDIAAGHLQAVVTNGGRLSNPEVAVDSQQDGCLLLELCFQSIQMCPSPTASPPPNAQPHSCPLSRPQVVLLLC